MHLHWHMISLQRNLALLALGMSQIWGKKSRNLSLVGIATTLHPRLHHHRISSKAKITKEAEKFADFAIGDRRVDDCPP